MRKMFDIDTREKAVVAGMTITELLRLREKTSKYLDSKGIRTAVARYQRLEADDSPNILYLVPSKTILVTPVNEHQDQLVKARETAWVIEIPVAGDRDFDFALLRGANAVETKLGNVTLADVVPISYADKGEIKKLIARLKKSTAETELKARGEELQNIISQYEDRANDTESDDLQEEFQSIVEALENGQQELEGGDKDSAINKIEESLFQ